MSYKDRLKAWWQELFSTDTTLGDSWQASRTCKQVLSTYGADHHCREVGPHYTHVCGEEECRFRWAR